MLAFDKKGKNMAQKTPEESIEQTNKIRKSLNLPLIVSGKRCCLRCDKEFTSKDVKAIRICDMCKEFRGQKVYI